ncbi:MAG: hypothetical protein ACRD1R_18010, partial [Acidobacteriota bacterium]
WQDLVDFLNLMGFETRLEARGGSEMMLRTRGTKRREFKGISGTCEILAGRPNTWAWGLDHHFSIVHMDLLIRNAWRGAKAVNSAKAAGLQTADKRRRRVSIKVEDIPPGKIRETCFRLAKEELGPNLKDLSPKDSQKEIHTRAETIRRFLYRQRH